MTPHTPAHGLLCRSCIHPMGLYAAYVVSLVWNRISPRLSSCPDEARMCRASEADRVMDAMAKPMTNAPASVKRRCFDGGHIDGDLVDSSGIPSPD